MSTYDAAYYQANREKVLAKNAAYLRANPEKRREIRNRWRRNNRVYGMFKAARERAARFGHDFSITIEDITIPECCPILGIPLVFGIGKPSPNSPSLDRIDSQKGYTKDNVWVISWRANQIKNDGTPEEHELIARAVRERLAHLGKQKL